MWYIGALFFVLGLAGYIGALLTMSSLTGEILHDAGTSLMLTGLALLVLWSRRPWAARSPSAAEPAPPG